MKSFTIFFAWIVALILVACSAEGDMLVETGSDAQSPEAASITVTVEGMEEKAPASSDMALSNVLILVFDRSVRVGLAEWTEGNGSSQVTTFNDLKAGSTVNIYAVANASGATLNGEPNTANRILKEIYNEEEFLRVTTSLTQQTPQLIKTASRTGYTLQRETAGIKNEVTLDLIQLTARIDLAEIAVDFQGGDKTCFFRLTSVELADYVAQTNLITEMGTAGSSFAAANLVCDKKSWGGSYVDIRHGAASAAFNTLASFYVFANDNKIKKTKLVIKGQIWRGNEIVSEGTWPVEIENQATKTLQRKDWYQLDVTMSGDAHLIKIQVATKVLEWKPAEVDIPAFS